MCVCVCQSLRNFLLVPGRSGGLPGSLWVSFGPFGLFVVPVAFVFSWFLAGFRVPPWACFGAPCAPPLGLVGLCGSLGVPLWLFGPFGFVVFWVSSGFLFVSLDVHHTHTKSSYGICMNSCF